MLVDKKSPFLRSVIINRGSRDHIELGMAVMDKNYLIGKVVEVSFTTSRVLLLSDLNSKIPVDIMPNNIQSILSGTGDNNGVIQYTRQQELIENDAIVFTSGAGGLFKSGVPIGKIYKNAQDKISINETEMMGKFFLVTEDLENTKWKMSGESKKIGQYTCYKATYSKKVEEKVFSFGSWNQNNQTSQNKKPKKMRDVEVVAWFTPEIPVSSGPSWYQGLPGLILEVSDDKTTILCTKIVMNPKEKTKIKRPKKGKTISNQDFVTLQDEKRAESLEMWRKARQKRQSSTARLR